MGWMRLRQLATRLVVVMLASAIMAGAGVGGTRANPGFDPPEHALAVPGGYDTVVTSQTVTSAGGTIGPVSVNGTPVTLKVPAGAFSDQLQFTLTAPDLAHVGDAGFRGYTAVGGVGVLVKMNGSKYQGTFAKQLTLSVVSQSINSLSVVVMWSGTAFVAQQDAKVRSGTATVRFDSDPDFAVLASAKIQGATSAGTGKPLLGEEILAAALVLLGFSGLAYGLRSRAVG